MTRTAVIPRRSSIIRQSAIALSLLALLTIVAVVSIGKRPFERYVEQQLVSIAQTQGIRMSLTGTSLAFLGMRALSGEIFIPRAFMLIPFSELTITPHIGKLLTATLSATIDARIAQGKVSVDLTQQSADQTLLNVSVVDLHAAEFSPLSFLGASAGSVTVQVEDALITPRQVKGGMFIVDATGIERPAMPLPLIIGGLPFTLDLPKIKNASLKSVVSAKENVFSVHKLESLSTIGTFSGNGAVTLSENMRLDNISFKGEVRLTDEGHAVFRSFIPLISHGMLRLDTKAFTFEISGAPPMLRSRFSDLG